MPILHEYISGFSPAFLGKSMFLCRLHQLFWANPHIKLSRGDSCPPFRSTGWPELLGCGARAWQRGRGPSLLDIVINQWLSGVSVGVESSNILGFNEITRNYEENTGIQ